jgi:pimeloyl-ACP methyl ester carboxylesterase
MAGALERILTTPWQETVARFVVPTLLIVGGDAAKGRIVTAETALEAAAICPLLEVAMLPEAGHNARREDFDGYVAAVTGFLTRVEV